MNSSAMFLRDSIGDGQTQSDTAPLAIAYERLKKCFTDGLGYSRAAVGNAQLDHLWSLGKTDLDHWLRWSSTRGLGGVDEQIKDCPLDHSCVHPALGLREMLDLNRHAMRLWM